VRLHRLDELTTVERAGSERPSDGPPTNGEVETTRGPVQVRSAPRLHLPHVDRHEGGLADQAE
jgi:hypothetical protein